MVICRWCKKTIVNAGNPQTIYSDCFDCKSSHDIKRGRRLNGSLSKISN